jgi:hypothetical protein
MSKILVAGFLRTTALAAVSVATLVGSAAADTRAACTRLRAEARSEAVVLYAPRVVLEGARIPAVVDPSSDAVAPGDEPQGRVSLALSPVDMLRGRALERVAGAECGRLAWAARIDDVIAQGDQYGRLDAIRAEEAYLREQLPRVDALLADAEARLERQLTTALEVDDLRGRRLRIRRTLAERREARAVLQELGDARATPDELAAASTAYREAALDVDRGRADLRRLDAWQVGVRAGVAAADEADWFGVVEVSYSLGGPWQRGAERRARAARADELRGDDRELPARVDRFARVMAESADALAAELAWLDDEITLRTAEHTRLGALEGDRGRALRVRAEIDLIELGARRVFVQTLVAARRAVTSRTP